MASVVEGSCRARELLDDYITSAGDGEAPNLHLADEYDASAGVLRRRAARPDRSAEQSGDELRRAEWYEKRAAVMRTGGAHAPGPSDAA